uniref:Uncharacterized protein LOC104218627 n=1 Tax=Nicotiana sylvestris TaxID=4096 RepID=A0A1U7VYK0_NICSY|nr:PREDICTED: uncharacterized protein LOC104218627 [Nicotiana sylvestris]
MESIFPRVRCRNAPKYPLQEKTDSGLRTGRNLVFHNEGAEGIVQPHNDAPVISVLVNKSLIKRVLIDPGSSANIIRSRIMEQLDLQDQIIPTARVLNGFNMACETIKGEIKLPVNVAETVQEAKFYVIEGDIRYNALFGRPWIHNMRAIASMLH